jgi:hypothetical protein
MSFKLEEDLIVWPGREAPAVSHLAFLARFSFMNPTFLPSHGRLSLLSSQPKQSF